MTTDPTLDEEGFCEHGLASGVGCSVCERSDYDRLAVEVATLRAALLRYARHTDLCAIVGGYEYPCSCGLSDALASVSSEGSGE